MGKKSKARRHEDKMKKKRAIKAARRSLYASLAGTSKKKKKRDGVRSKSASNHKHAHIMANCGNPGCQRCYPRPYMKGNGQISTM